MAKSSTKRKRRAEEASPLSEPVEAETLKNKLFQLDAITYYLNSILTNISQGLLFIDFEGTVTTYNTAAQRFFEISPEHVLFRTFWSNFDDKVFGFSMRSALSRRKAAGRTYAQVDKTGQSPREIEIETTLLTKEGGETGSPIDAMQGIIVLFRDITEMRRLQQIEQRHDRLKELGEMAAMVAHEIRNPLGGIKGFASLLARDLKEQPNLLKMANYIVEGTDTLNRLVTTILNYARPVKLKTESVDLNKMMLALKEHVEADSGIDKRIKIAVNTKEPSLQVQVDSELVKSAVLNLVVNATQAMPEGGTVTLETGREAESAFIKVIDTGCGITPENIPKLYSPFFTTRANGNGFGLAEVLKIVQAHGGKIDVASELGKGTCFTIKIPINTIGVQ